MRTLDVIGHPAIRDVTLRRSSFGLRGDESVREWRNDAHQKKQ